MRGIKKLFITTAFALALNVFGAAAAPKNTDAPTPKQEVEASALEGVTTPNNDGYGISKISKEMETDEAKAKSPKLSKEEKRDYAKENDSWGGGITLISMCVVIGVLAVLSLLFYYFGKISSFVISSRKIKTSGVPKPAGVKRSSQIDSGETIAAIALAVSEHFYRRRHDFEDTILTIRRMRRNYSPWNSKIYNLRQTPELRRNVRR